MSNRKEILLEKRAQREKEEAEKAYLEGLIRLGRNDDAVSYLKKEHGATEASAERIVARYAGAIGEGRHSLSTVAKIAIGIIFASLLFWASTTVMSQRLFTHGEKALVLYFLHWLAPLVIGAALAAVVLFGKGSLKTRAALCALIALFLYVSLPPFLGAWQDMKGEPVEKTLEVTLSKHYGDPRVELVPKGAEPNRRYGHFLPRSALEGITGNRVVIEYWEKSGVVKSVKEAP